MSNLITPEGGCPGNEIQGPLDTSGMVCPNCRAEYRPGFATCSDCRVPLISELSPSPSRAEEDGAISVEGLKCSQHPEVDAVAKCRSCSRGVCGTCDFQVSGALHLCPNCIDNASDEKISPRRKNFAIGALAAAVYCTLAGVFTFSGALYQAIGGAGNKQVLGLLVMYGLYFPSVAGTVLAFSAFERRLKNTPLVWTALIWNATLTVVFILLEIVSQIISR